MSALRRHPPAPQSYMPEPRLRIIPFALHFARGLIRDRVARRRAMFAIVLAAMLMVFAGATFLEPVLSPRDHPGWFLLFWAVCGWLTFTALLLACFDVLMMRAQGRAARKELRQRFDQSQ